MEITHRRSIAILVFGPLLLAMAAGQAASFGAFVDALRDYEVLGASAPVVAALTIAAEALVGLGLLARRRLPARAVRAAAVGGLVVTAFWALLAGQAFARGLTVENCGCFGTYLSQELRWWVLVEDAEFLVLAVLAARAATGRTRERGSRVWRSGVGTAADGARGGL